MAAAASAHGPAQASRIRLAALQDAAHLPAIEQSAAQLFRTEPGLEWLAAGPGMAPPEHERLILQGSVWVAEVSPGTLAGFLCAEAFGPELHVWEVSVHRAWQRTGLGRRLLRCARDHAAARGLAALTLTTFADLPWNAPAYARLGFHLEADPGPRLQGVLDAEAAHGLPKARRVAMRLALSRTPG